MFEKGFPGQYAADIKVVLDEVIPNKRKGFCGNWETKDGSTYMLENGELVSFPYRIYCEEIGDDILSAFTPVQKLICHAIYSRSYDGFVREKHIGAILRDDYPEWMIPYIVKPADEYVVEILELLYQHLKRSDTEKIKQFCKRNLCAFLYGHARMISYWDVFYREYCYEYKNYVGKSLFEECFGYTRSMEKQRSRFDIVG